MCVDTPILPPTFIYISSPRSLIRVYIVVVVLAYMITSKVISIGQFSLITTTPGLPPSLPPSLHRARPTAVYTLPYSVRPKLWRRA